MARELTKKQKGFVKDYVATGNGVKSAQNNYKTKNYNSAGAVACKELKKVKIQKAILSIANQIPDSLLVKKHLALLNKTQGKKKEIDVLAVKAGLEMAYKLKGIYAPEKHEVAVTEIKGIEMINPQSNDRRKNKIGAD